MAVSSAGSDGPALHVIRPAQPTSQAARCSVVCAQPRAHPQASAYQRCDSVFATVDGPTVGPCEQNCPPNDCTGDWALSPDAVAPSDRDADDSDADTDPNSLLPRWLPDGSAQHDGGWLAKVRADPGRAGAIALAAIAAIAVLVTVFTLMREQPAPVMSAKLPPVDMAATASRGPSPGPSARPNQPVVVSVVGLVHTPGLVTLAPGARIADALKAAGGSDRRRGHHRAQHGSAG